MEKELKIGDKLFVIREMKAIEMEDIDWTNSKDAIKKQVLLSTGMNEDSYKELTVRERIAIIKEIVKINALDEMDFQKPVKKEGEA